MMPNAGKEGGERYERGDHEATEQQQEPDCQRERHPEDRADADDEHVGRRSFLHVA